MIWSTAILQELHTAIDTTFSMAVEEPFLNGMAL